MFESSRTLRRILALITAAALLWSVGAEACSDWIDHERSHTTALGEAGDGDPSAPATPAVHDKCCHACHHLQAHLAPVVLVPAIAPTLPKPAPPTSASHDSSPDIPYHPPRTTTLA